MSTPLISRRDFLKNAGAGFVALLPFQTLDALANTDAVYASATRGANNTFGVAVFNQQGDVLFKAPLPTRGHDVAFHQATSQAVAFARRPGTFAVAFDPLGRSKPFTFSAPKNRHFFGHGVYSPDGKLLYASENDFDNSKGIIGIYETGNSFHRVGEFSTHGIGPHEVVMMPDGRTLCVANGGIETHPDYGRAKLNISTMQSSLCFIDSKSGSLIEKQTLPQNLYKLSIRHMVVDPDGAVIFGAQYQGPRSDNPPLAGKAQIGQDIQLWQWPEQNLREFADYIGSVALGSDGEHAAMSSPHGNVAIVVSIKTGKIIKHVECPRACGLARCNTEFLLSSDRGHLGLMSDAQMTPQTSISFDNHMTRLT